MLRNRTVGLLAGSFDLMTRGHVDVVVQAAKMVDLLYIMVATNSSKKSRFDVGTRIGVILDCIAEHRYGHKDEIECSIQVRSLDDSLLLVNQAHQLGAHILFRGIRNTIDFEYEKSLADVNREIQKNVTTVFVTPRPDMSIISSSLVDGVVGKEGWEKIVKKWVHTPVIRAYKKRNGL